MTLSVTGSVTYRAASSFSDSSSIDVNTRSVPAKPDTTPERNIARFGLSVFDKVRPSSVDLKLRRSSCCFLGANGHCGRARDIRRRLPRARISVWATRFGARSPQSAAVARRKLQDRFWGNHDGTLRPQTGCLRLNIFRRRVTFWATSERRVAFWTLRGRWLRCRVFDV